MSQGLQGLGWTIGAFFMAVVMAFVMIAISWYTGDTVGLALILGKKVAYSLRDSTHAALCGVVMGAIGGFCAWRVTLLLFGGRLGTHSIQFSAAAGFFFGAPLASGLVLYEGWIPALTFTPIGGAIGFGLFGVLGYMAFGWGTIPDDEAATEDEARAERRRARRARRAEREERRAQRKARELAEKKGAEE